MYKNRKEIAIYTKEETIHKTMQKHRTHKNRNTQNKKTSIKRVLEDINREIIQ
jgi:hypothetical protein